MKNKKKIFIVISILFVILGCLSFGYNLLGVCITCDYTHNFTLLNQGVYSSMLGNDKIGFMHNYGLQTRFENIDGNRDNPAFSARDHICNPNEQTQLRQYLSGTDVEAEDVRMVYKSKVNLGAVLSTLVDRVLRPIGVPAKIIWMLLHGMSTILAIMLLVFWAFWLFKRVSLFSSGLFYGIALFSYWLIPYGSGLSNSLFAYLLPFTAALMLLHYEHERTIKVKRVNEFLIIFFAIMFKAMMGFEGMPTLMISCTIPYFYYALAENWDFKTFFKRFINVSVAAISGMVATVGVLFLQLSLLNGSTSKAIVYLSKSVTKRTWGTNLSTDTGALAESMSASFMDTVKLYSNTLSSNFIGRWSIDVLLIPLVAIMVYVFVSFFISKNKKLFIKNNKHILILIFCVALSILGSYATLLVMKSHSLIHWKLTSILFYIPFILYASALIGEFFKQVATRSKNRNPKKA